MAGAHLSKDFFDLIKAVGEAKSKQEEDRIIQIEIGVLKKLQADRANPLTGKRLKEFLVRLLYVEMLGHDASFGYMRAVELSASANLMEKRVSYLCAGLCFAPEHEFRMMLVNRLQRDLKSANVLECAIALSAAAKILTADMIPAVLPGVVELLKHDQELVRKKAVMLVHRFLVLQPESVAHLGDKFRRALCDKCPEVMGASLHIFYELCKVDPAPCRDLVSSFVSILKQITEHRLPRDFDYHRCPAPWLQLKILRILGFLGRADQAASEQIYEVLLDVMRKAAEPAINIGYAIVFECVRTVTTLYPNAALLDAAAASIARFIQSDNHNLKYLGVTGLASIVRDHPKYAAEHQMAVIDCLEDNDDTMRRRTLDLLYRMTNPVNVEVITAKLIEHLRGAGADAFLRADLVTRISQAAERFAPSNAWYVTTMVTVFELGGDLVRPEVALNLCRLVAEGGGESEAGDAALRLEAVTTLIGLLDKPALPDLLLQVMFWVLGEYGHLAAASLMPLDVLADRLAALAGRAGVDAATRGHALGAVLKIAAQLANPAHARSAAFAGGLVTPGAQVLLGKFGASRQVDLAQRVHEIQQLCARPGLLRGVLPVDASTEDLAGASPDGDLAFGFLDSFVADALSAGARPYQPPVPDASSSSAADGGAFGGGDGGAGGGAGGLRFEAYERNDPTASAFVPGGAQDAAAFTAAGAANTLPDAGAGGGLNLGAVRGGWSREGFKGAGAGGAVLQEAKPMQPAGSLPGAGGGGQGPQGAPGSMEAAIAGAIANAASSGGGGGAAAGAAAAGGSRRPWDAVPAAAPEPPKPRELTERERLAASLFGGVPTTAAKAGGGAAAGAGAGARSAAAPTAAAAAATAARPVAAAAPSSPAVRTPAAAPAAAAKPPVDDLLGLFDMGPAAPAPAPAPRAAAPFDPFGGGGGGGGGFGGGLAPQPALSAFGAAAGPAASAAASPASLAVPASLLAALGPAAASPQCPRDAPVRVAGDALVSLWAQRIFAPDALHVAFFVRGEGAAVADAQLTLAAHPPHLAPSPPGLQFGPGGRAGSAGPLSARTGALPPAGQAACVVASFALAAVPVAGQLRGQLAYGPASGGAPQTLAFALDVPASDCLRAAGAALDTPQFGAIWQQPAMNADEAVAARSQALSAAELLQGVAQAGLNLHPVQAIAATGEAIAAARVMGLPTVFCLCHLTLQAGGAVRVQVRSADRSFSAAVAQAVLAKLR